MTAERSGQFQLTILEDEDAAPKRIKCLEWLTNSTCGRFITIVFTFSGGIVTYFVIHIGAFQSGYGVAAMMFPTQ